MASVQDTLSPNEEQVDWTPESQMYGMPTVSAVPRSQAEEFDRKISNSLGTQVSFAKRPPEQQMEDINELKDKLEATRNKGRFTELPDHIKAFLGTHGLAGFTLPNESPTSAYLNINGYDTANSTAIHEGQHIKQNSKPSDSIDTQLTDMVLAQELQGKYQKKYGLSSDFVGDGFYPELARIENTLPEGKSLFDTDIGQDILKNNPAYRKTFFDKTIPNHTPQMTEDTTPLPQRLENHNSFFQDAMSKLQEYIRNATAY